MLGNNSGFTLIEVLLVFALIAVVSAVMAPLAVDYQRRNDVDTFQVTFVQALRRAQQLSMSGEGDSQWGVIAASGDVTVFKGSTFSGHDANYDEIYNISDAVVQTGQVEYDFAKITGLPAQTGTATFTDGSYQKTVVVNAKGVVNY